MSYNWNLYREQFPTRYWQHGAFDEKLSVLLQQWHKEKSIQTALDVGGGVLGTLVLKEFCASSGTKAYLLDPFVKTLPDWMQGKIQWQDNEKFDLIVARGSINYLTPEQLQKLSQMLKLQGILVANTFLIAPSNQWSQREVQNAQGEKGLERSRLVGNTIEHEIIFNEYTVKHTFYYYSLQEFERFLGKLEVNNYAKNSSMIILKKN